METIDAFSIFMAGLCLGLIGSHYLNKSEVKLAYERGVLDTVWEIQRRGMEEHLARLFRTTGNKETGSSNNSSQTV